MAAAGGWIEFAQPRSEARLKLFCFPFAGGAAQTFRLWHEDLPAEIQVCPIQLPGRWTRLREPPFMAMKPLVEAVVEALLPELDRPFALYGHSLGALVAFETARMLRSRGGPRAEHLVVSSRRAPHLPNLLGPIYDLPDEAFVVQMRKRYDGIPREVLASPELLEILLPAIKADMSVYDTYRYMEDPPLECPITVFGGRDDATAPLTDLQEWEAQTASECVVQIFPGGHFFIADSKDAFFGELSRALEACLASL
jgi:surfactin synthase thioesterase subunit